MTIPAKLFQTWHSKDLPPLMRENVELLKQRHPNLEHFLFDDDDCLAFIQDHFDPDVADAFVRLIPGAFKADLWRYCVLYIHGGIYLDIKFNVVDAFRLDTLLDKEHFVKDKPFRQRKGVYNALMVCQPGNPVLHACIEEIVKHVRTQFYGENMLEITGPLLVSKFIQVDTDPCVDLVVGLEWNWVTKICSRGDGTPLLAVYAEYRIEQREFQKTEDYCVLWNKRKIYT